MVLQWFYRSYKDLSRQKKKDQKRQSKMSELFSKGTQAKFTKNDFYAMYDNVDRMVFESWIEDIKKEIGWRKGKQVFPPAKAKIIIDHIGEPISLRTLNR